MSEQNIDLIALNETRLDRDVNDNRVKLDNYQLIRKDRNQYGGGVCIYLKNHINFKVRCDVMSDDTETIVIDIIKPNSKPFAVVVSYRPPESDPDMYFDHMTSIFNLLDNEQRETYLLGDLNCDLLSERSRRPITLLNSFSELSQLEQLIKEPTRCNKNSQTLIDVILTNTPERVVTSGVLHLGISDHSLVYVVRKVAIKTKSRHRVVNIRSMKNVNVDRFKNELTSLPWSLVDNLENANDRWELWKSMFMNVVDNHAPLKRKRLRNKKSPWMNANLKQLFLQRDKLKKLAVVSKNPADWKKFKDARNTCNNKIRQAKTDYYHQYFKTNSGNPKEIWKSINELMSCNAKSDEISHLTCNDRVISDSADLTECFNTHFAEIGLKLRSDEPDELNNCGFGDYLKQADTVFTLELTTPSAVFKLLSSLQEGKAMGLDEIPAKLLKCARVSDIRLIMQLI